MCYLDGGNGVVYNITGDVATDIHLYPDLDLALILCRTNPTQAYIPVSFADVAVGTEIGVAGYPLATLKTDGNGNLTPQGLVYRVAKGVATAVYRTDWDSGDGHPLTDAPVVEVNFLFVPGNSGGPIFDAERGRAFAYVKGMTVSKVGERLETCTHIPPPPNIPKEYLDGVQAVYSVGLCSIECSNN